MRIAVTGGSGFIGGAVIRNAEARGHEVWAVDRQTGGDILGDLKGLKDAQAVIHLAGVLGTAELFDTIEEAVDINVRGSVRVMSWCVENDAKYIGILMPDVFKSIYTATKIASQRLANALVHSRGLKAAHVRAFNAYGPRQAYGPGHPQKIIPTFAVKAWRREPLPIWGSGNQAVDLIHVDDIARMLVDAADILDMNRAANNLVLDGGTGIKLSVNQVAAVVAHAAGWSYDVANGRLSIAEYLPMRAGEAESQDVEAKGEGWEHLGWRPRFDIDLIAETVQWYRDIALA